MRIAAVAFFFAICSTVSLRDAWNLRAHGAQFPFPCLSDAPHLGQAARGTGGDGGLNSCLVSLTIYPFAALRRSRIRPMVIPTNRFDAFMSCRLFAMAINRSASLSITAPSPVGPV